jgi:hypothetical protein
MARVEVFRNLALIRVADLVGDSDVLDAVRTCLNELVDRERITGYGDCEVLHDGGKSWVVATVQWDRGFQMVSFRFLKDSLVPEMVEVMEVMES